MIRFSNLGEIDIRLVTTLGVNVKEGDSPIGYFGTGLKYAIAVLLREKCEISVYSGTKVYRFSTFEETFRGKAFNFIQMSSEAVALERLGFTTELGKNWTLKNAYRELYSNCMDEGGEVHAGEDMFTCAENQTHIVVNGSAFDKVHRERYTFLLDPARLKVAANGMVEAYAGQSLQIFYRGIAAYKLDKPTSHLYNFLCKMDLTEDRTITGSWFIDQGIENLLCSSAPESLIEAAVANEATYEHRLDFFFQHPGEVFLSAVERLFKERPLSLSHGATRLYTRHRARDLVRKEIARSRLQEEMLFDAIKFCHRIGYPVDEYPIKLAKDLGERILALAEDGTIWLTERVFQDSLLRAALVEEFFHLRFKLEDSSRAMQDKCFAEIVRLGERSLGQHKAEDVRLSPLDIVQTQ